MTNGGKAKLKHDWQGPTAERIIQSQGALVVGDDQRGGKVYHFQDSALERIYGRLKANAKDNGQRRSSESEERALKRYYTAYIEGGMMGSMRTSDMNGSVGNPASRDHAAKSAWQLDHRDDFHEANARLTVNQRKVCEIVVLGDASLEVAGYEMGKRSQRRAIQSAERILRDAGGVLAVLWNY
jgi:hypothetical protein